MSEGMKRTAIFILLCCYACFVSADIRVRDDRGRNVVLESPAQRIVALSPHIVENLYAIGAGEQIAGAVEYSDFPEAAKKIPRVGRFSSFSLEAILALQPDLVISWGSGNGDAIVDRLTGLGIAVYVDEPDTLDAIARSLRQFGTLTGREMAASQQADAFAAEVDRLSQAAQNQPTLRVFYQIWHEPIQTINGHHIIDDIISLCGGTNIFSDAVSLAPKVSVESVIAANPQTIIASGANTQRPPWLDQWQQWPAIDAVQNNHIYFIDPDYLQRHTPRILIGARQVCGYLQEVRGK